MSSNSYQTIIDNLWNYEERHQVRRYSKAFRDFNGPWNKNSFNSHWKIGKVMAELTAMPAETTRKQWATHYLKEVRSPDQVVEQVQNISNITGLDFVTALNWWWILVLDTTYGGWEAETKVIAILAREVAAQGYLVRHATDDEDRTMGIDAVVYNPETDQIILGAQIKGEGYFRGKSAQYAREVINPRKYKKWIDATGSPVWYITIEPTLKANRIDWRKPEFTAK